MPRKDHELVGRRFGMLLVLEDAGLRVGSTGKRNKHWKCRCDCGEVAYPTTDSLSSGKSQSCGCQKRAGRNRTHGKSRTKVYRAWQHMQDRCYRESDQEFSRYGARGIRVCRRWRGKRGFENFLADMGEPLSQVTLERKDNDGPYSPANCVWADRKSQARNRRSNLLLTLDGRTQCLAAWVEQSGLHLSTIQRRLRKGWPLRDALLSSSQQGTRRYAKQR